MRGRKWSCGGAGNERPDKIEILPVEGSDIEIKVVVNGEVVCTFFLSDVDRLFVYAGSGDDTIVVSDEIPKTKVTKFYGGAGNDIINGGAGNDIINGGTGNNTINGGGGNDDIWGRDGTDTINGGGGNDTIKPGTGANEVEGGDGNDSILDEIDEVFVPARASSAQKDKSHDVFDGGPGDDRIIGGGSTDTVKGGPGNDHLRGGKDDDVLKGNDGRDDLDGQGGTDRLTGGEDNDTLRGGAGSGDRCDGGPGKDRIFVGGDKGCRASPKGGHL